MNDLFFYTKLQDYSVKACAPTFNIEPLNNIDFVCKYVFLYERVCKFGSTLSVFEPH